MATGATMDYLEREYSSAPLTHMICSSLKLNIRIMMPFVSIADMGTPALVTMASMPYYGYQSASKVNTSMRDG